jgi:hypothetical protein
VENLCYRSALHLFDKKDSVLAAVLGGLGASIVGMLWQPQLVLRGRSMSCMIHYYSIRNVGSAVSGQSIGVDFVTTEKSPRTALHGGGD